MAREKPKTPQDAAPAEPPTMPVSHAVPVPRGGDDAEIPFAIEPDAAALARIASFLGVEAVGRLTFTGVIRAAEGGRDVAGRLTASVVQSCVVTLDPVETAIDTGVLRRFRPGVTAPEGAEIELDPEADSAPEPLGAEIDLGAIMIEALVLSLDPYPRAPGAELGAQVFAPPGAEPLTDEAMRPFAQLAQLRDRLGRREE